MQNIDFKFLLNFSAVIPDDSRMSNGRSCESLPSYGSSSPSHGVNEMLSDEQEEKARLISQVLELQNTLDGEFFN